MDFEYAPEQESFRKEFRAWLRGTCRPISAWTIPPTTGWRPPARCSSAAWPGRRRCTQAGWVGIAWPQEYGGRGASIIERVIWDEEYSAARAPVLPGMGLNLVGPTIIHWGTDAQKRQYLPKILNADEIWAQGFSEPGAGSDLASLRTRAEDRGDHYLVNGQKVWTSGAQYARLDHPARAHRSRRAQAQRHLLPAGRSEIARRQRAAAGAGRPGTTTSTRCSSPTWWCRRRSCSGRSTRAGRSRPPR